MAVHGLEQECFAIVVIKTSGDRIQDRPLAEAGGKGLFTKEIEEALRAGAVDLAVHSAKDMATRLPDGLAIGAVLEREDVRDAFISIKFSSLREMPAGAKVGTSSIRRQAQVKRARPDLQVVNFRGNVDTRLAKLEAGVADATFLAAAGLNRLGASHRITCLMPTSEMLPAVAQGAIVVEARSNDAQNLDLVAPLEHRPTALAITAERAFLARLDGSCRTPIAGLATVSGDQLELIGQVLRPDGSEVLEARRSGPTTNAGDIGDSAAADLLARAGPGFFAGQL